jgi:hypothetical protein
MCNRIVLANCTHPRESMENETQHLPHQRPPSAERAPVKTEIITQPMPPKIWIYGYKILTYKFLCHFYMRVCDVAPQNSLCICACI